MPDSIYRFNEALILNKGLPVHKRLSTISYANRRLHFAATRSSFISPHEGTAETVTYLFISLLGIGYITSNYTSAVQLNK